MEKLINEFLNWDVIKSLFPEILTEGAKNTLVFTGISFVGAMFVGLVIALSRMSQRRMVRWPAATFADVLRGLPATLTIVLIGFGIPIATAWRYPFAKYFPGCLALSLVGGAYISETIRAGIEAVPKGQMEAARSLGLSRRSAMRLVILPQAFRIIIPPLTNELVLLFKDTALLAVLGTEAGGKELTKFARDATNRTGNSSALVAAGIVYLIITLPLLRLVGRLERRAKGGAR